MTTRKRPTQPPRQCATLLNHGRCRRLTTRANGLCAECDKQHAARQFVVLDSYIVGAGVLDSAHRAV